MSDTKITATKRLRFSVIDFVIILMVIACLVGVIMRYDLADRLFSKTVLTDARVSFVAESVLPAEKAVFVENTVFYTDLDAFGTLISVESKPARIYYENSVGALVYYEHDTLQDLSGSFRVKVLDTDSGYRLNGNTFLAPGSVFTVKAGGASVVITIISVEAVAE